MKYFTIKELTASATAKRKGIDNRPTQDVTTALVALVDNVLDPLRQAYGKPIIVTSGYRCTKLNKAVGGASFSQHVKGEAADIRSVSDDPKENKVIFDLIRRLNLPFDQLIWEYGERNTGPDWVHVSFSRFKKRGQVLSAVKKNGKTIYSNMK